MAPPAAPRARARAGARAGMVARRRGAEAGGGGRERARLEQQLEGLEAAGARGNHEGGHALLVRLLHHPPSSRLPHPAGSVLPARYEPTRWLRFPYASIHWIFGSYHDNTTARWDEQHQGLALEHGGAVAGRV
jgi:hypothetical protein